MAISASVAPPEGRTPEGASAAGTVALREQLAPLAELNEVGDAQAHEALLALLADAGLASKLTDAFQEPAPRHITFLPPQGQSSSVGSMETASF